jgi:hypothetical protein
MTSHRPTWTRPLTRFDTPADPPADANPDASGEVEPSLADQLAAARADADKWKRLSRQHEERSKANADKARRLDEIEAANASDLERAAARADDAERRAGELLTRAVTAEVRAAAAATWADPDDAPRYLDLTGYVDDAGAIDTDAIARDLDAVLKAKPHLARTDPQLRVPPPDPAQGPQLDTKTDFTTASREQFATELARYRLRPRS